ncbi:hypothetical protein [Nocardia camponoti]|uniref:Uncharacterized protein n=1 Tax=Nocardia camponoti TaxID=1616106 RepID=A0A917V8W5_9NOCA|nr:hypothetical protein [Nocardia camponoti]GGK50064.1 hypothetical protein GCM10011591_21960 [Nocardia camponoti]
MSSDETDAELWAKVVAAERNYTDAKAAFYQNVSSRRALLSSALRGRSAAERAAALDFLDGIPKDVPLLVDELIDLATHTGWALYAKRAIGLNRARREVRRSIEDRLRSADSIDFRRLAELLWHMEDWATLRYLTTQAAASSDPETREVGEDFDRRLSGEWFRQ